MSEAWVSSVKRRVHGVGGVAGVGTGTPDGRFLHKGSPETRICVLKKEKYINLLLRFKTKMV